MITPTRASLLSEAAAAMSAAGFDEPRRQARRLLAAALNISPAQLFCDADLPVARQQTEVFKAMLSRVINREPLSRILGRREFWGLEFSLSSGTLDPRPATETVVEAMLSRKADRDAPLRLLDLGTGSGCLLSALLSEFLRASGVGIDITEAAVRTAAQNAARLGLADRALFCVGDWASALSGKFDAIVANPPYIPRRDLPLLPTEVVAYDPWQALDGGEDGLAAYRAIAVQIPTLLASDGIFVTELGVAQADEVAAIMEAAGLVHDGLDLDLAGIARCLTVRAPPPFPQSKK
ncbi:MAG: peptide chain release factor N(5)-glutamine methyltransferase [Stellaceae bacterium]